MRLIDADALKGEKFYSYERHENCVSVYAIDMMPTIEPDRPHGECKIYHARFEDRIACKCGFMQVITGHWDDYNYCQRCGRKALKEGEEQ